METSCDVMSNVMRPINNEAQKCNIEKRFLTFIILITSYKIEEIPRQKLRFSSARLVWAEGSPSYFSPRTEPGVLAGSEPDWGLPPSWRWFSPPAGCRWPWSCRPGPVRPPRSCHWKSLGGREMKRWNLSPPGAAVDRCNKNQLLSLYL